MVPAEVAAVGASHYGIDDIPSYSSVGPTLDGRIKPDILVRPRGTTCVPASWIR